jgi:hypothetical protein
MSYYLVKHNNEWYANDELFTNAIAKGERAFMRLLANREVESVTLFDQVLYKVTPDQEAVCEEFTPCRQDFDEACRYMNVLSRETIRRIAHRTDKAFPGAWVIYTRCTELYTCNRIRFIRVRDFNMAQKYRMVPKLASVRICGRLYIAVNTVNIRVKEPAIVTVSD